MGASVTYRDRVTSGQYYTADYLKVSMLDGSRSFDTLYSLTRDDKKSASDSDVVSLNTEFENADLDTSAVYRVTEKKPVDVAVQDQISPVVDCFLTQKLGTATLAVPTAFNDRTITLSAGHGFVAGNMIEIDNSDLRFYQSRVRLVVGNVLTVTNPLPYAFGTTAIVKRVSADMNINGSVTPVVFSAIAPAGVQWDINILAINILDDVVMDDAKFGGITALTNGVCFRTVDGEIQNIFTALDNGCFRRHCDTDSPYSDKAPAGLYGFNSKRHFNGQNGDGVARRIGGEEINEFQAVVADDISGLTRFWCVIRGHVVED